MLCYHFSSAIIFEVKGKDSQRYLNARLTNDARKISPTQACMAAALTPQGRTQGLFTVVSIEPSKYILACDGGDKETVLAAFKKYLVADRVEVLDLSQDHQLVHLALENSGETFPPELSALNSLSSEFTVSNSSFGFVIKTNRVGSEGFDIVSDLNQSTALKEFLKNTSTKLISKTEYDLLRTKAARPSFPEEINEDFLFSAFDLDKAVSFNKGCYVGQEVVEKIDSFARLPNVVRLAVFEGELSAPTTDDSEVIRDEKARKVGNLISACYEKKSNKTYAFIEIKNETDLLKQCIKYRGASGQISA